MRLAGLCSKAVDYEGDGVPVDIHDRLPRPLLKLKPDWEKRKVLSNTRAGVLQVGSSAGVHIPKHRVTRPKRTHRRFPHDASGPDRSSRGPDISCAYPARPEHAQCKYHSHHHRSEATSSGNPAAGGGARMLRTRDALHLRNPHARRRARGAP